MTDVVVLTRCGECAQVGHSGDRDELYEGGCPNKLWLESDMSMTTKKWDAMNFEDEPAGFTEASHRDWTIPLGEAPTLEEAPALSPKWFAFRKRKWLGIAATRRIKTQLRDVRDSIRLGEMMASTKQANALRARNAALQMEREGKEFMGQAVDLVAAKAEQDAPMSPEDTIKYTDHSVPTLDAAQLTTLSAKTYEDMYTANFAVGSVELRRRCAEAGTDECPPLIASSEKTKACWTAWRARPPIKIISSRAALPHPKQDKPPSAEMVAFARIAAAAKDNAEKVAIAHGQDPDAPPLPARDEEESAARLATQAAKDVIIQEAADLFEAAKRDVEKAVAEQKVRDDEEEKKLDPIYYPEEIEVEYEEFDEMSVEARAYRRFQIQDPNWVAVYSDAHSRNYYYHVLNRKTVWEKPRINLRCKLRDGATEDPLTAGTIKRMTQYYHTMAASAKKEAKAEAAMSNRRCTTCGKLGHNKRTCFQRHDGDGLVPWGSGSEDEGEYQAPQRYDPSGRTRAVGRSSGRNRSRTVTGTTSGNMEKDTTEGGKRIIQKILSARRGDRSQMCEYFLTLPEHGELQDYYDIVDRPISIAEIKKSLKNAEYVTIDDLRQDFSLMFDNARTYNEAGSFIIEDVLGLERALREAMQEEEGLGMLISKGSSSNMSKKEVQVAKVAQTGKMIALKQKSDKDHCDVCTNDFTDSNKVAIMCDKCEDSFHLGCLGMYVRR